MARNNRTDQPDGATVGTGSDPVEGGVDTVGASGESPVNSGEGADGGLTIVRAPDDPRIEVVEAEMVDINPLDDRAMAMARHEANTGAQVAIRSHPALRQLDEWLSKFDVAGGDTEMIVGDIIAQVLSAESLVEILEPPEAIHARDLLDVPIVIHGFKSQRSDYQEGSPRYAVMDVTREDTGQRVPVTCGAQQVLAQLVKALMMDAFPFRCAVVRATKRPTDAGNWPIRLAMVRQTGQPVR